MFTNINDVIAHIIFKESDEILKNKNRFLAFLTDLAPNFIEERKILSRTLSDESMRLIYLAKKCEQHEIENRVSFLYYFLIEDMGINEKWSQFTIDCFFNKTKNTENNELDSFGSWNEDDSITDALESKPITKTGSQDFSFDNWDEEDSITDVLESKPIATTVSHNFNFDNQKEYEPKVKPDSFSELIELAISGNEYAQYAVGYCYTSGIMVEKNKAKGMEYQKQAASANFVPSQYNYATLILNHESDYSEDEVATAEEFLRQAIENEHIWAVHYMGVRNEKINKDFSISCYEKSSYPSKEHSNIDKIIAVLNMYKRAALLCINMIDLYQKLIGVAEEYEQTINYGSKHAQFNLGIEYQLGKNVPKDLKKAFDYFSKAAEQGEFRSCFELAYCYEKGLGTEINCFEAEKFYDKGEIKAKENGYRTVDREFFKGMKDRTQFDL